jgi:hypothetical protein
MSFIFLPDRSGALNSRAVGFLRTATGAGSIALATRKRDLARTAAPWSVVVGPDPRYMAVTLAFWARLLTLGSPRVNIEYSGYAATLESI